LCAVPDLSDPRVNLAGVDLPSLAVIADAVSTPYQAILRSGLAAGDLAVFVGVGGIGGFGVQIANAFGAVVAAIDIDAARLAQASTHGATVAINASEMSTKELRQRIRELAEAHHIPTWRTRIFETSGTPAGQVNAFALLGHGSVLSIVGFTPKAVEVRLSNLMAFDAVAQGNWGCLPEHYPAIVDLALSGRVALKPFVEARALSTINTTFEELHTTTSARRVVLIPEH
jgi:6-hydroxycyclohex-1-ene-1-carbonyl-CoA dehydrogenase